MFAYRVYNVVQLLISEQYETAFLQCKNQKSLVLQLVMQSIAIDASYTAPSFDFIDQCSTCNTATVVLLRQMLPTFINVFLNNYVKRRYYKLAAAGGKKGKRKLQTLK